MVETDKIQQKLPNQEFDYFKIGKILVSRWYWIAASVFISYAIGNTYLWVTPKTYSTSAKMKFEDKKSEISDVVNVINNSDKGPSKVQTETFVIQSRSLILSAVKDLNYPISFYVEGRVRTSEIYPAKPLKINLIRFDSLNFYHDIISFKPVNKNTFSLDYKINGLEVKKNYLYNNPVDIASTTFTVDYPGDINKNSVILFNFNDPEGLVGRVQSGLRTSELIKNSNIISLQETDSNPQFAADILNAIMVEYLNYDRKQKQQSATKIIYFIDKQLDTIKQKVQQSANAIEDYKQGAKIMDVGVSGQFEVNKANEIEAQRNVQNLQYNALAQFKQEVIREKDNLTFNFTIDANADQLTNMISSLNTLLNERVSLLRNYNADSQPVKYINDQIFQIKNTVLASVNLSLAHIQQKINYLDAQLGEVNKKIADLPLAERKLVSLNRDFEINEKVYSLLSEKKLDAQISRSAILPGATIIEKAQPNFGPVSPNESEIHRNAIVIGLAIGLGLIVLIRVLNPYIYDKETVESLTVIPIIGVIRKFPRKINEDGNDILVLSQPKSIFAESVRSVRTNLSFLASEKKSKVICITSEVAGEGKSFVAVNLASTLSLIDKKIILIAADLRRSKMHKTFHITNDVGLSNFLAHKNTLDEIIIKTNQENLHFIPSGPVPPNPSELLHTERMTALIEELKLSYDIIIIDTAPVGLVSDSIPLIRLSDINVFVIRSGKSKFYAATIPQRIAQEYNLNNSVIVLNAFEEDLLHSRYYTTKFTGDSSGGKYYYYSDYVGYESSGYYVDHEKYNWWDLRRLFKK